MSAFWTGVSGMSASSEKMQMIGNNLANVNTVGFKSSYMVFQDLMSKSLGTADDTTSQIGLGTQVSTTLENMSQGAFETGSSPMDMAIGGQGFFVVTRPDGTQAYTRAGNFRFNKSGLLTDPQGDFVQGFKVDQAAYLALPDDQKSPAPTAGGLSTISLGNYTLTAMPTVGASMSLNLNSSAYPNTRDATDPYFSLFKAYNARNGDTAMPSSSYDYSASVSVYDSTGATHPLKVYFDRVSNAGGTITWQYLVADNVLEDGSTTGITSASSLASGAKNGVLMLGTMSFDSSGNMTNMSAYTPSTGSGTAPPTSLSGWSLAQLNGTGKPIVPVTFRSASSSTGLAAAQNIALDFGLTATGGWQSSVPTTADGVGTNASALQGFNPSAVKTGYRTTTSMATSSTIFSLTQDGYGKGYLTDVKVTNDGLIEGQFTNGQTIPLYQVALADCNNIQGLKKIGSNLYIATADSGAIRINKPTEGRLGTILGNTLESSNVDMASSMVDLIVTQRSFQANTKVVTTMDSVLSKAIELKR